MRAIIAILLPAVFAYGQTASAPAFAVASVKPSQHVAGRDARGKFEISGDRLSAHNVSLKDLIVEAYGLEPFRISGPGWLDENEYDVEARADGAVTREQLRPMLQRLSAERFQLTVHREQKTVRVHALVVDRGGFKLEPRITRGFHADMKELARVISIQLTIPAISDPTRPSIASGPPVPVIDNTGLTGIYDFPIDLSPRVGADMYELWQQRLREFGLRLESKQISVDFLVVDGAQKVPVAN